METEQNEQKIEAQKNLSKARKDKILAYAKTAGWTAVPVLVFGGVGTLAALGKELFESKDLGTLVQLGLCVGAGYFIGANGMVRDYIEKFRDYRNDVRYASNRTREYRTQLQELE